MCARFTLKSSSDVVGSLFELDDVPPLSPRYNIAPTQDVLAVIAPNGERQSAIFRWGFIPQWGKEASLGQRMINARSETAAEKPSFRSAFKSRRCLVIADGFFEWTDPDETTVAYIEDQTELFEGQAKKSKSPRLPRQPWWIGMKDLLPFAFAGLWELNQLTELGSVETCCILTTTPNDLLEPMHDRMPVIIPHSQWSAWLDPALVAREAIESMLVPFDSKLMQTFRVSPRVNSPRAYGADLIEPLPIAS